MRHLAFACLFVTLATATAPVSEAQTLTVHDPSGARAGFKTSYGGRGVDWETSVESPRFGDLVRLRAALGQGRWVGWSESLPPGGGDPVVTRVAGAVVFAWQPQPRYRGRHRSPVIDLRPYVGVGYAAYVPQHPDMKGETGVRFILGVEGSGLRWTVGPEIELDAPRYHRTGAPRVARHGLAPTARIGIAVRRRF